MELGLNQTPPEEQTPTAAVDTNLGTTQEAAPTVTPPAATPTTPTTVDAPKPDEFIENFNKRYGTQYKGDDDVKGLFETTKKISEYEGRLTDYDNLKKSAEERQKEIERLEGLNDPLKYFSSPEAYKAEQLRIKYPDKDPFLLQEVATTDVNTMDNFDLLVKAEKLFNRNLPEGGRYVKDVLYKRYGLDGETKPEEWDGATKTQIAMDANVWRTKINDLKNSIEYPKVATKEERAKLQADSLAKKMQDIAPLRNEFTKFDKFSLEGLDYEVPNEYKAKSSEMFDGMFIDANMPVNEENIAAAIRLRDSNFLYENFGKIREVIIKQAQTDLQARIDKESHNDQPPNTATASDQGTGEEQLPGIGKLVESQLRR